MKSIPSFERGDHLESKYIIKVIYVKDIAHFNKSHFTDCPTVVLKNGLKNKIYTII